MFHCSGRNSGNKCNVAHGQLFSVDFFEAGVKTKSVLQRAERTVISYLFVEQDFEARLFEESHVFMCPQSIVIHEAISCQSPPLIVAELEKVDGRY